MAIIDPEGAQVALDRAMSVGLMGYPPILGKRVTIRGMPPHVPVSSLVREPDGCFGTVESVGPLGFVIGSVEYAVFDEGGVLLVASGPDHVFFPWTTTIAWGDGPQVVDPMPPAQTQPRTL